jgi:hypothetical protein
MDWREILTPAEWCVRFVIVGLLIWIIKLIAGIDNFLLLFCYYACSVAALVCLLILIIRLVKMITRNQKETTNTAETEAEQNLTTIKNTVFNVLKQYSILLYFGTFVIIVLIIFQVIVLEALYFQLISSDIFNIFINLSFTNPQISAMYFSNFTHQFTFIHIFFNVVMFFLAIVLVMALHKIVTNYSVFNESPRILVTKLFILIFILLPLPISGLSILFGGFVGLPGCIGFSGITYAILGYFEYLLIVLAIFIHKTNYFSGFRKSVVYILPIFFVIFILSLIMTSDINPDTNYPGHIFGFLLGIIFPFFLNIIFNGKMKQKIASLISLITMIAIFSFSWMLKGVQVVGINIWSK